MSNPSRPPVPDVALAVCLAGVALLTGAVADGSAGRETPDRWWEWLLLATPSLALVFRRVRPLVVLAVTVVGQMVIWGTDLAEVFLPPLVMIYTVVADGTTWGRRAGALAGVALTVMTGVGVGLAPDVGVDLLAVTGLTCLGVVLIGSEAARGRAESARLAAELAVSELERAAVRDQIVVAERSRIAGELHDLLGHSLSVIAVRAEAAQRVGERRPEAVTDAVDAIGTTARSSLAEVRRVLAGLREEGSDPELAPVPTLHDLDQLVESVRAAGVEVTYRPSPTVALPATVGAGAYRIVQEAMTNVLKHAGPDVTVELEVAVEGGCVQLRIADDGRGPGGEPSPYSSGIAGMTERADVLGGSLRAGPRPGGGFQVVARLPVLEGAR